MELMPAREPIPSPNAAFGKWRAWAGVVGVCLSVTLAGCERAAKAPVALPGPPVGQQFEVRGVVKRADATTGRAVIAHEEIAGYMSAMTMEFEAAVPGELKSITPGDVVTFRLLVTDTRSSIDHLHKVGRALIPPEKVPGLPENGAPVPEVQLVDETGRAFHLADFHGKVVALTFIFTRCPLPDFCPRMSNHFAAVAREMAKEAPDSWELVSVSIDPGFDTPAVLAGYAAGYRPAEAAARWRFATGEKAEIQKLGTFAGLATQGDGAALQHNLRTLVVGRDGKLRRIFTGNEWKPEDLVGEMRRALK